MTQTRPFEPRDLPLTVAGLVFGAFYGFMGVLVLWFVLFDLGWMIVLITLPLLVIQLVSIFAFDGFLRWRRRNDPPPPPLSWVRLHAMSLGSAVGITAALIFLVAGRLFGAAS